MEIKKKKPLNPEEEAKKDRVAFVFSKDTEQHSKGEIQLLSLEMAELFKEKKLGEQTEVSEEQYSHLIQYGKIATTRQKGK